MNLQHSSFNLTLAENPLCNPACSACHYKNLEYSNQLEKKQAWAEKQLGHWPRSSNSVLRQIRPAPENERLAYRSKSWLRSFFQNGQLNFGMFRAIQVEGSWEKEFVSWNTCPLHSAAIQEMIERLRNSLSKEASEFAEKSLVGVWMGSPHCVVISRDPQLELVRNLDWKKILVPPFDRVWFHQNSQVGKKIFGHHPIELIFGAPNESNESVDGSVHPIRAFRQIAQTLLIEARDQAVKALLQSQPQLILDLYCGTGALSTLIPANVGWLGIEISKEAVSYAKTLRSFDPQRVHEAFTGAVEDRLKDQRVLSLIQEPYALYLNPPRSGLTSEAREKVSELIREKAPATVVYLSCSASSLSRDLEMFESQGYGVQVLQPYDFFPQTEHFETLAILNREQSVL